MTALFVHGVPETTALWKGLVDRLDRDDVHLLGLPGFGSPMPGFEPTMYNYADWLSAQLSGFEDVDLVAHDWGGLLALRVLADRPPNIRSWVLDIGDLAADFEWHDLAKLWISPQGEEFMAGMVGGSVEDRAALLTASGIPESGANDMAAGIDETMAKCILALYRSSVNVGNEWGPGIDQIAGPGLIVDALGDPFKAADRSRRLADRTGAEIGTLADAGHWWMLDSPDASAELITEFWKRLPTQ